MYAEIHQNDETDQTVVDDEPEEIHCIQEELSGYTITEYTHFHLKRFNE
jgi:hypothetical protein